MRAWATSCFKRLLENLIKVDYLGYDPYDGLNSRILRILLLDRIHIVARGLQQVIKRLPFNPRPLLLTPKGRNSKGLALCLSALCRVPDGLSNSNAAEHLVRLLENLRSPDFTEHCWGYNFRWESSLFSLPPNSPNAICTVFAGESMLHAWQRFGWRDCRDFATGAAEFLRKRINVTESDKGRCYSYTTFDNSIIHNVNLLVTAFLWRAADVLKREDFCEDLNQHLLHALSHQREDGAWPYGENRGKGWVDGIHQGFNLVALDSISRTAPNPPIELRERTQRGFQYYLDMMFTEEGIPKFFDNRLYPIDTHNLAVAIVTLCRLSELDSRADTFLEATLAFSRDQMWMERVGWFAFQKRRLGTVRIPYTRWNQCWMLYALSEYLRKTDSSGKLV